jgi:hypothetical protein
MLARQTFPNFYALRLRQRPRCVEADCQFRFDCGSGAFGHDVRLLMRLEGRDFVRLFMAGSAVILPPDPR